MSSNQSSSCGRCAMLDELRQMDNQFAPDDYLERLCVVVTRINGGNDAEYWPALRFSSKQELLDKVKTDIAVVNNKLRAKISYLIFLKTRLAKIANSNAAGSPGVLANSSIGCGVAYLLGKSNVDECIALEQGHNFVDFYDHFEAMEMRSTVGIETGGDEEFCRAFDLAMNRMNGGVSDNSDGLEASIQTQNNNIQHCDEGYGKQAVMPTSNKSFSAVEYSAHSDSSASDGRKGSNDTSQSNSESVSRLDNCCMSVVEADGVNDVNDVDEENEEQDKNQRSQVKKQEPKPKASKTVSTKSSKKNTSSKQQRSQGSEKSQGNAKQITRKMSKLSNEAETSKETKPTNSAKRKNSTKESTNSSNATDSTTPTPENNYVHIPFEQLPAQQLYPYLKTQGWTHKKGNGLLSSYIYIHPRCKGMGKTELINTMAEGVDYFMNEQELRKYARENLGWLGDAESSTKTPSEVELADRIKKRRRAHAAGANNDNDAQHGENKTEAKLETITEHSIPESIGLSPSQSPGEISNIGSPEDSSEVSEVSRFSQVLTGAKSMGSISKRTRSKNETPTSSDSSNMLITMGGKRLLLEMAEENKEKKAKKKGGRPAKSIVPSAQKMRPKIRKTTEQETNDVSSIHESPQSKSSSACSNVSQDSTSTSSTKSDPTYELLSSKDAWLLLMEKFNFSMSGGFYCLPGKENRPCESSAVKGVNYFKLLEDLRKNLCAYGLPEAKAELTEDEQLGLHYWVRYAHVRGLAGGHLLNEDQLGEPFDAKEAWSKLMRLGFKWQSCYIIPASDPSDETGSSGPFAQPKKFDSQKEMIQYLARFGIPDVNLKENVGLSADDRLKLDLFIACAEVDTFMREDPTASEDRQNRRSRRSARSADGNEGNSRVTSYNEQAKTRKCKVHTRDVIPKDIPLERSIPSKVIDEKEAFQLLQEHYNFTKQKSNGLDHFCLPDVDVEEDFELGHDVFENIEDLRLNLCAYGIPTMKVGAKIKERDQKQLEFWVRCATVEAFNDIEGAIPPVDLTPLEAWEILEKYGYTMTKRLQKFFMPYTNFHNSTEGVNQFASINKLFDDVARFGIATKSLSKDCGVSKEEKLKLELYVASVSTFDVFKRINRGNVTVPTLLSTKQREPNSAAAVSPVAPSQHEVADISTTETVSNQPAVVVDEGEQESSQDSSSPSPQKKPRTSTIDQFFMRKPSDSEKEVPNELPAKGVEPLNQMQDQPSLSSSTKVPTLLEQEKDNKIKTTHLKRDSSPRKRNNSADAEVEGTPMKKTRPDTEKSTVGLAEDNDGAESEIEATPVKALSSTVEHNAEIAGIPKKLFAQPTETQLSLEGVGAAPHAEELESETPAEPMPTFREKLDKCLGCLDHSHKSWYARPSSNSCGAASTVEQVMDFMMKIVKGATDPRAKPHPGILYVCGGPGTGKTSAISSCSQAVKDWAKENGRELPYFCFFNMSSTRQGKDGLMKWMTKRFAGCLQVDKETKFGQFEKILRKKHLIVVLDEVDMMFDMHAGIGRQMFKSLVSWADDPNLKFSIIGISNCIGDDNAATFRAICQKNLRQIVFPTYNEDDITNILYHRIGRTVMEPRAVEFVAKKIASNSGDVRRALEISSNAVQQCKDAIGEENLDNQIQCDNVPIVKLVHMMRAMKEAMPPKQGDIIAGLPKTAKVILCIAVTLAQVWGPTAQISIATLQKFCVQATQKSMMDDVDLGHVSRLVEQLVDCGLLITSHGGAYMACDTNAKLKIGVQLSDVELALEETLLSDGGFYCGLVNWVKTNHPTPMM